MAFLARTIELRRAEPSVSWLSRIGCSTIYSVSSALWSRALQKLLSCSLSSSHAAIFMGVTERSLTLALAISATRRSYAVCKFSQDRASPPKERASRMAVSGGNAPTLAHHVTDSRRRYAQRLGERIDAHAQGRREIFAQQFSGMHRPHAITKCYNSCLLSDVSSRASIHRKQMRHWLLTRG